MAPWTDGNSVYREVRWECTPSHQYMNFTHTKNVTQHTPWPSSQNWWTLKPTVTRVLVRTTSQIMTLFLRLISQFWWQTCSTILNTVVLYGQRTCCEISFRGLVIVGINLLLDTLESVVLEDIAYYSCICWRILFLYLRQFAIGHHSQWNIYLWSKGVQNINNFALVNGVHWSVSSSLSLHEKVTLVPGACRR